MFFFLSWSPDLIQRQDDRNKEKMNGKQQERFKDLWCIKIILRFVPIRFWNVCACCDVILLIPSQHICVCIRFNRMRPKQKIWRTKERMEETGRERIHASFDIILFIIHLFTFSVSCTISLLYRKIQTVITLVSSKPSIPSSAHT